MRILDKLSRVLSRRAHQSSEPENRVLAPYEIRLIAEGKLDTLADFAASARLHFADPKGDTPLHLVARTGNLALCDLFIRSGADPKTLNHERQTPADVAFSEGHELAAQLLSSLVSGSPTEEEPQQGGITATPETSKVPRNDVSEHRFSPTPQRKPEAPSKPSDEQIEKKFWTVERNQELTRLWSLGAEPSQIAQKLGGLVTPGAILNQIHGLGIYKLRDTTRERTELAQHVEVPKSTATSSWPDARVDLPKRMWADGRSANQIARELGGVSRNAVLSKAHRLGLWEKEGDDDRRSETVAEVSAPIASTPIATLSKQLGSENEQSDAPPSQLDDFDDLLVFEAEEEPEQFFVESEREAVSGSFVALVSPSNVVTTDEQGDWNLDLSPASIVGEGIGAAAVTSDNGAEHDFLKVRNRGRQSIKSAVVQSGTRLSIDPEICTIWAKEILQKGWYWNSDIEGLLALCDGNGDLEELRINLQRNLEVGGFDEADFVFRNYDGLWDSRTEISSDELSEAIEAALTRSTRLPGTQRFVMDKSDERQLLEPMVRAKQELQLGILASEAAIQTILDVVDTIQSGVRNPSSVSLKTIIPSRPGHPETAEVLAAAESLKSWQENGRVMDGKRRRQALSALEALDLSLGFQKELISSMEQNLASAEHVNELNTQISLFEAANERLVRKHLPYARRFAARNVEEGEDPEDVFQVAFMGLQRSTRRFDPERGYRFVVYATYWMRQGIMRWRADEGATIRIPVHRKEKIARLDLAMDKLDIRADGFVSERDLAVELEWTAEEVSQFRAFPREAVYPESIEDWDELFPGEEDANAFDAAETEKIIADALAELPEREADIIRMRFGIDRDSEMTLEEIGQIYGVTRERIRQIEAKALDRLSHPGRKRQLQDLMGYDTSRRLSVPAVQHKEKEGASETDNRKRQLTSWTRYRVARLEELWAAGMSASEIAEELGGTSRNAVIGKLSRLGLAESDREQLE